MRSSLRSAVVPVVLLTLACAGGPGGCSIPSRGVGANDPVFANDAERIAQAQRLAAEGDELRKAKRLEDAIGKYKQAVTTYPRFYSAWLNMGVTFTEQGKYLEAREALTAASEIEPSDPEAPANLGDLYQMQRWYDDAARNYTEALKRNPYHARALRESVRTDFLRNVRTDDTLSRIRRALEVERDPAWRSFLQRQKAMVEGHLKTQL